MDDDADGSGRDTGNRLAAVPLNAANLWSEYAFLDHWKGLRRGGGLVVVDQRQNDNAEMFQLPVDTRLDLATIYRLPCPGPALTAQRDVQTLLGTPDDEAANDRPRITAGAPRVVLASSRVEF